ncbi:unnamed protein product [Dibothriocephalus latus]|uniref:tRNA pseudouridine(55) synthase n=1 Tax=Dibothriocephalus latus TaxID=60516 RepID=A0A3P6U1Y1_DIBLA|nr:unnamed protein product [Dibothriocephalus latus]
MSTSKINLSLLNAHLICGLCGGYLIDATVLTNCVHAFCRSCILRYLLDNKVCPLCDSLIHEGRPGFALRPDITLQRVVYKLVPGLLRVELDRIAAFRARFSQNPTAVLKKVNKQLAKMKSTTTMDNYVKMNHPEDAMFLEQLGVCKLCQLRLLDGPTFHSYSFPRRYMDFLMDKVDSVCVVCFGLLQSLRISHAAAAAGPVESSGDVISQIIQVVMSSSYRFSGFQLNISEPADISLRDRAVWALLAERHQQAEPGGGDERLGDISAVADVAVPAKVVFRNLAYALIKEQLLKLNGIHKALFESDIPGWFDPSTEQVSILVSFNLLDPSGVSKLYMDRLTDAVRQTCPPRLWSSLLAAPKKSRRRRPFGRAVQELSPPEASTVSRTSIKQLLSLLPDNVFLQKLLSVEVSRVAPLVVAGRYVKLCRKLPQTPWILDGERKLETSVEELIAAPLVSAFGPGTKYNFVSSGREDIDVRCLGLGRPFMLEISNYAHTLASMLTEEGKLLGEKTPSDNAKNGADDIDASQLLSAPGDLSWMARRINLSTDCRVFVRDLQVRSIIILSQV